MVVDITYRRQSPHQLQHVRMITVYAEPGVTNPEIVLHFDVDKTNGHAQHNIPLSEVRTVMVTRD